jgi:hypothetical protein
MGQLEVEHIIPAAAGGSNDESNLWLACRLCNCFKAHHTSHVDPTSGQEVLLFHPRSQKWNEHFQWSADGTRILGTTACGRATVEALRLNNLVATTVRRYWVEAGWHPPEL